MYQTRTPPFAPSVYPATVLSHPSNHVPNHGLQSPLLLTSGCKAMLEGFQTHPELHDLATSISFRQNLKGIEETNLHMTLVSKTNCFLSMSSCFSLGVLELFIEHTGSNCPMLFSITTLMDHLIRLMFEGVV
jgi:hypothetical protein